MSGARSLARGGAALVLALSALLFACSKQGDVIVQTGEGKSLTDSDIDRDPLALLPGGAIALSYLDAKQMFASRFGNKLLAIAAQQLPLPPAAGFDPKRDLSGAYTGVYSMSGADVAGVAIGTFDKKKIEAAADGTQMTPLGVPVTKSSYAGRTLYTAGNIGFTVLTARTALFGNDTGIRRALDRIKEGRAKRQLPPWMDKLLSTPNAPIAVGADLTSQPLPDAARSQLPFLEGMKTIAMIGNFQEPGLNLAGTLSYADEAGAQHGADNLLRVRNTLESYAPFMALLGIPQPVRQLKAEAKDKEVSFVMGVDGDAVGVLLDKARDFLAVTRPPAAGGS
ncbi:MAG TPA: hypothetical protein VGP93_20175 [Polyangiaceae bacterium]|jgi:hypothetical protein|nr:hypothetical protein [Polyangiaceae bacterium]